MVRVLFLTAILLTGAGFGSGAAEPDGVVILNSNSAIENYRTVESGFTANWRGPLLSMNLGGERFDGKRTWADVQKNKPGLLYCIGSKAYSLAHQMSPDRRIVFSSVINWRRLALGERSYGVSSELPSGMSLTMFRYLFPEITSIGALYSRRYNKEWMENAIAAGREVGITVVGEPLDGPGDLSRGLEALLPQIDVLWLIPDPVALATREAVDIIFTRAEKGGKPIFAYRDIFVSRGALLAISADTPTMGAQAAALARDLMRNRRIPQRVQSPAGSFITLNQKKLAETDITFNDEALDVVNRIVR